MRIAPALGLLLLLPFSSPADAAERPETSTPVKTFSPERFFAGRTTGEGELRVLAFAAMPIHVRSTGRLERDGTLVLRQTIRQDGAPPRSREWLLKRSGGNRFSGSLTDAAGPVTGEVSGNRLYLRYTMKGALRLRIQQWLTLEADGRTLRNRLTASKFGLPVAVVRETIRKAR